MKTRQSSATALTVQQAEALILQAPLHTPFRIATGQHDTFANTFLRIQLSDGSIGWGEAGIATHITGETLEETLVNLQHAALQLIGTNLANYRSVCSQLNRRHHKNHAAQQAVEIAVLDAISNSCAIPLWRLFGHKPKKLQTDITIVIGSAREAANATRRFHRKGFKTFKIKIGTNHDLDVERIQSVAREAPGCTILLDANQAFTAESMLALLKTLRRHRIRPKLLEQPVPREDWDGLRKLTRESGTVVCADESVRSLGDAVFAIKTKAVHAINLKLAKTALFETAEIARITKAAGLKLMIGAMLESALSISAAAHFAAGFQYIDYVDLDTTYFIRGPLARTPCLNPAGHINVNTIPAGIGVTPKT
jgi:L-alanine-DL-glutamate epimerase-like enolase superfamily enzyme